MFPVVCKETLRGVAFRVAVLPAALKLFIPFTFEQPSVGCAVAGTLDRRLGPRNLVPGTYEGPAPQRNRTGNARRKPLETLKIVARRSEGTKRTGTPKGGAPGC